MSSPWRALRMTTKRPRMTFRRTTARNLTEEEFGADNEEGQVDSADESDE